FLLLCLSSYLSNPYIATLVETTLPLSAVAFQIQESETNGVERQYFWNFYPYFSVFLSLNEKKLPIDFVCIIKRYKFAVN
ncbi:hypothetical protein, partial [uncultured Prevotella sp.]|uniref:hypothetical protein n=1 Tax=uncultured Prevotella sp. TaxID=159272 RepID=UPI0025918EFE